MVLGHAPEGQFESMVHHNITATVCDIEEAKLLSDIALSLSKKATVHLALDTGMSRIGWMPTDESLAEISHVFSLPGLSVEGAFSHFAKSDTPSDLSFAKKQLDVFNNFIAQIRHMGITLPILHICNSAAIFSLNAPLDMVRVGIALYGLHPSDELALTDLKPVMHLRSRITQIKTLAKGTPISYSCTYVTKKDTQVATVCAGYADGLPRHLSGKGYLLVNGKKAPILGRVCMDQLMIDISEIPEAKKGDTVTVFGIDSGVYLSADEVAGICGTIGYEVITGIDRRVPRISIQNGEIVSIDSSLPFC